MNNSDKKINWLKKAFSMAFDAGISIDEKKLISEFVLVHGSTERKAKDLIQIFVSSGIVVRKFNLEGDKELVDPLIYKEWLEELNEKKRKQYLAHEKYKEEQSKL
jgi:hypothetical protein